MKALTARTRAARAAFDAFTVAPCFTPAKLRRARTALRQLQAAIDATERAAARSPRPYPAAALGAGLDAVAELRPMLGWREHVARRGHA